MAGRAPSVVNHLFTNSPFSRFIQIIHVHKNHSVTVSNINIPGNEIFQDSVCIIACALHLLVANSAQKQICSFVRPKGKSLQFHVMNMQLQDNLNDCGLFVVQLNWKEIHVLHISSLKL